MLFPVYRSITCIFFFNDAATTEIYTLSLHDALPISWAQMTWPLRSFVAEKMRRPGLTDETVLPSRETSSNSRSEEHTSELQSPDHLVCRLLLEKKKNVVKNDTPTLT